MRSERLHGFLQQSVETLDEGIVQRMQLVSELPGPMGPHRVPLAPELSDVGSDGPPSGPDWARNDYSGIVRSPWRA